MSSPPPKRRIWFRRGDGELIVNYLQKKVNNEALPHNGIRDVNLHHHNPAHLTAQYPALGDKIWYFFTPRYRKYVNGYQPNRAAGDGYWKATGANKLVDHKDQVVGRKKALVYYEGKPGRENSKKTNWIMHEFQVEGPPRIKENQHDMKLDDWVLCKIYKKEVSENGKKGEAQGQVPEKWEKGRVQAQHKPVDPVPSPAANDNDLKINGFDTDSLFAQNSNPAPSQNSDNIPV